MSMNNTADEASNARHFHAERKFHSRIDMLQGEEQKEVEKRS